MWETFKDIYLSVNKASSDRIKSPFYGVYVLTWLAFNWSSVSILLFSNMPMENRVSFINSGYPFTFIPPLLLAVFFTISLPFANEKLSFLQSKPLTRMSIIMARRKKRSLTADIGVERFRAKRDVAYERHKVGAENEIQQMREQIASSTKRTDELVKELTEAAANLDLVFKNSKELSKKVDELENELAHEKAAHKKALEVINTQFTDKSKSLGLGPMIKP